MLYLHWQVIIARKAGIGANRRGRACSRPSLERALGQSGLAEECDVEGHRSRDIGQEESRGSNGSFECELTSILQIMIQVSNILQCSACESFENMVHDAERVFMR